MYETGMKDAGGGGFAGVGINAYLEVRYDGMKPADVDELFRMYYRPLCLYASHFLGDLDACEEVVQAGFAAFWERVQEGMEPQDPRAYLFVTVRNRCAGMLLERELMGGYVTAAEIAVAPEVEVDEEEMERGVEEARVWTAIDRLPPRRREILLMSRRDGVPAEEIAEQFGISVRTVRNQVSRALRALRRGAKKVYLFFFG